MKKLGAKALKMLEYLVEQSRPVTLAEVKEATGLPGQIGAGAMTHLCNKYSNLVYKVPGNPPKYVASAAAAKYLEQVKGQKDQKQEVVAALTTTEEPAQDPGAGIQSGELFAGPTPILSAAELINLNATAYVTQAGGRIAIHVVADNKAAAKAS